MAPQPVDPELLDQRKQTQRVSAPKGVGPRKFSRRVHLMNGEGVVEMGNGGDIPGVAGHGACAKSAIVVDKIGDDIFDNLLGKPVGRG